MKSDTPLLSRHFPAAEVNLNQRLLRAQQTHVTRQLLSQLSGLLSQGNNRRAVSDFIRQQYGQTALNQLTPEQLKMSLRCSNKANWQSRNHSNAHQLLARCYLLSIIR